MVQALFDKLGIQGIDNNGDGCSGQLFGYYACDRPPRVGFQFGGSNQTFYIDPEAFEMENNGNNNCTATITGSDIGTGAWIVGQSWFQGKYVDFDATGNTVGVALLA